MTVMELAAALGTRIAEDEILVGYREAKAAYESNAVLREAMFEYNTQRSILGTEFKKPVEEQNPELIAMVRDRIDVLAKKIVAEQDYKAFSEAQQRVNALIQQVNSEISFRVFGERPCTHDCSSCHADCGHRESEE